MDYSFGDIKKGTYFPSRYGKPFIVTKIERDNIGRIAITWTEDIDKPNIYKTDFCTSDIIFAGDVGKFIPFEKKKILIKDLLK